MASVTATVVESVEADITKLEVDAIVNAANSALAGGGGVDGAIHAAAGPAELASACRALGGCAPGEAKVTPGFKLPAKWIIHTVGPVWRGGGHGEAETLASCYINSLKAADRLGARSIAFPAISTGVYGYPAGEAAEIAVTTVRRAATSVERVLLVAFNRQAATLYQALLTG